MGDGSRAFVRIRHVFTKNRERLVAAGWFVQPIDRVGERAQKSAKRVAVLVSPVPPRRNNVALVARHDAFGGIKFPETEVLELRGKRRVEERAGEIVAL